MAPTQTDGVIADRDRTDNKVPFSNFDIYGFFLNLYYGNTFF